MQTTDKVTVYHAHWIQVGTNEGCVASAHSKEDLDTLIYGRAYGPKYRSIFYWTTEEEPDGYVGRSDR